MSVRLGQVVHGHSLVVGQPSPTYQSWTHMRSRCLIPTNHAWPSYGGRGITICERWNDFREFLADMGERPPGTSLDRINNDGNYEPANCRWATPKEQHSNRRNLRLIDYLGLTLSMKQWASKLGLPYHIVRNRLQRGWTIDRAFTQPVGTYRRSIDDDPPRECEKCGDLQTEDNPLIEVEDNDESVGYHGTVIICERHLRRRHGY